MKFHTSCVLALALLTTPPTPAQEPETDKPFYEQVSVDVVNVEVYVTDKEGNPVTDLTRDDFEVSEDGKPVELMNFYRVAGGRASMETDLPAPLEQQAEVPEDPRTAAAEAVPESQRLHLIVFVDNYDIHPLNRNRVFRRLYAFINRAVKPGDEVMVASWDRSLHIRHPFTSDPSSVHRTLEELEEVSGMATDRESDRSQAIRDIYESKTLHSALSKARRFAEQGYHDAQQALDGLEEMVDSLAGLPGRKILVHVSDGLPMVPGQDLYQAVQQAHADISALGEAIHYDLSRRYSQVIADANSNRTSFYMIDASGLTVQSGMGAENAAANTARVISAHVDGTRRRNLQSTLKMMAEETGGLSIMNTNDVREGLERFTRDFDNYYSLGYRSPASDRGRYHKIEVRLQEKQKGWSLRYREGYRDKTPEDRVHDAVTSYLVHGYQANPHGVSIELGPQVPGEDGNVDVAFRVVVPMAKLVLLPRGDVYVGRLRLYFGAVDEEGRDAPLQELPFELQIPAASLETALRDQVARVIHATMRPGSQRLVVAVRDEISEEKSVVGFFINVGS